MDTSLAASHWPVLVVEEDPVARDRLCRALAEAGYRVTAVDNGRRALERLDNHHFPIVVTDWVMPEVDGPALCRAIRQRKNPGYVFVEMACEADGAVAESVWFLIKETTGVGDFIGSDGKPTSMPDHDVVQMLAACEKAEEEPGLSGLSINKGDQVKITDGAFESYEGEVEAVDERRGMVNVIVSIFGRMTPVEVGYWQLEKVE